MKKRPYRDAGDLQRLQSFNANAAAQTKGCGYLHPGDIPHHVFNGNKYYVPSDLLTIWEDESGIAAWALAQPRHKAFDAQLRPSLRGTALAREVYEHAETRTAELMRRYAIESDSIGFEAWQCDTATAELLNQTGWTRNEAEPWTVNRIDLKEARTVPVPSGYRIRSVRGPEEAAAVAEVHASAFPGARWTPELYRYVMESPGYAPEREFVAEAPDGSLVAFTVTWHDPLNRTGLLEPVGTHADHRRRGLARALIAHAMTKMKEAGMTSATVVNHPANEAARSLYRSCGFSPWQLIDDYTKPLAEPVGVD